MIKSLTAAFAGLILTVAAVAPAAAQMRPPVPLTVSQFDSTVAGTPIVLAVRVVSRVRDDVRGEILERIDDADYKATGKIVDLYYPQDTPTAMGSGDDVKAGAVVFVHAVATTRDRADVKRATIVTPYVTIK